MKNYGVQSWRYLLEPERGMDIWEIPFVYRSYREDNDTTDSEEMSNEDKAATMMTLLQWLLSKKRGIKKSTDVIGKGLKFFIKEESLIKKSLIQ